MSVSPSSRAVRYWAFISYSSRDAIYAKRLHGLIEAYGIPTPLCRTSRLINGADLPKQLKPVFRDREELPATANLGSEIEAALADSRHLIVLCSPASAQSPWVNREVRRFRELQPQGKVIAVRLASGKPEKADGSDVPPVVHEGPAFVLDAGDNRIPSRETTLAIIARLCGIDFDILKRFDLQRQTRRLALTGAGCLGLAAFFSVATWYALEQRHAAMLEQRRNAELLQFTVETTYPLVAAIERTDVLEAVQRQVNASLDPDSSLTDSTAACHALNEAFLHLARGDTDSASRHCHQALALLSLTDDALPANSGDAHVFIDAHRGLANCAITRGENTRAIEAFHRQSAGLQVLMRDLLSRPLAERELIALAAAEARAQAAQGDALAARAALRQAEALLEAAKRPDSAEEWSEMLEESEREVSMSQGELEYLFGDLGTSETAYRKALAIAETQLARDRRNPVSLEGIAAACEGIGAVLLVHEQWADSMDVFQRCRGFRAAVAAIDSSDSYKPLLVAISDNNLGEALFNGGEVAASLESFSAAKRVLEELCRRAPGNSFQERILAVCEINSAGSLRALGRHAEAYTACDRAKALCEKLLSSGKAPQEVPVDMAREAYQRGKLAAATGYAQEAEVQFRKARDSIRKMADDAAHPLHRDATSVLKLLNAE